MTIGKRITVERKRKGLSQEAFAKIAGVSFSSQRRYEDGRSAPDTGYLETLRNLGVDVDYILSGELLRERQDNNVIRAYVFVIAKMCEKIGCSPHWVFSAIDDNPEIHDEGKLPPIEVINTMLDGCFPEVNGSLLSAVLQGIDTVLENGNVQLSSEKKANAASMLYRAFKTSGKVDPAMIEEAVKLAAG